MFQRPNDQLSWIPVTKTQASRPESSKQKNVTCSFCGKVCAENDLPLHQRDAHKHVIAQQMEVDETFCGYCIKTLEDKQELLKHTLTVHLFSSENALRIEHEIFICDQCNQIFFTKLKLINHITWTHKNKNIISKSISYINCDICKRKVRLKYYATHSSKYHPYANLMTHCFKCDFKSKSQTVFRDHFKTHAKYYHCNICRYSWEKESSFNTHVLSHRQSEKIDLKCDVEKYFVTKSSENVLNMNSLMFQGIWLPNDVHLCVMCRELCYNKNEMQVHIQSHKPIETRKVSVCECGQEFSSKILLKQHKFQFKGEHTKEDVKRALEDSAILDITRTSSTSIDIPPSFTPSTNITPIVNKVEEIRQKQVISADLEIIRNVDLTEQTAIEDMNVISDVQECNKDVDEENSLSDHVVVFIVSEEGQLEQV